MTTITQRSFSAGEISPSLYARVDLVKYATGLRTCRNCTILRYGGASNRSGTQFIGEVKDSSKAVRLVPFAFNAQQTYMLEFGDTYMRVIKDSAYLTDSNSVITNVTQANPAVVTTSAVHGLTTGEEVYIGSVSGMTELNNRNFKVTVLTTTTYSLQLMDGTTNLDTTGYTAYSSGGTSDRIYEIVTPYSDTDVGDIKYVQSADVVTIVHPDYAPRELARTSDTTWTLTEISFQPSVGFPKNLAATAGAAGANIYSYQVTAVDSETGEESLAGTGAAATITNITQADPAVVTTSAAHGYTTNDPIFINSVVGMTELNNRGYFVNVLTATTFELVDVDSINYTAYSSAGSSFVAYARVTAAVPTVTTPNNITWSRVFNAVEYNIYKETNGVYGQIGVATGTSFDDINITANTGLTPPISRNPFVGTGNYPSTVTYIQQRLAFANTDNDPEKIFLSRTANFKNFTKSSPSQRDDAITFNIAGRQVNEVKNLVDLGRLVVLTSGGEHSVEGESGVITPTTLNPRQYSYNGSGDLQPILVDGSAIYQQARGSIIRDLAYSFEVSGYRGDDLTIFSSHLFDKFTLVDWAYQQIPHSILWTVRSDGALLGMTFVKNQEVIAWHRHDFNGTVENVAVIPEGNEDFLYLTINRTIDGNTVRYVERLSTRQYTNIEDAKFMDSFLTYDGRNTTTSHTMTLSGGTTWEYTETLTLTSSTSFFTSADVGNAIHLEDSSGEIIRLTIEGYTSGTVVTGKPHKTVPASLRSTAVSTWTKAVDEIIGLWHLEGEDVSVFADEFVVASPNNDSYDTVTVNNGGITLDKPYGLIHIGIPYISDIESLDVDTASGETLSDKNKIVGEVNLFVEESRGIWSGPKPPSDDTVDPLEGLTEFKLRNSETYENPVRLITDTIAVKIKSEWNSNGRVFVRQVDPIPMTVLSMSPAGKFPFSG